MGDATATTHRRDAGHAAFSINLALRPLRLCGEMISWTCIIVKDEWICLTME
jgi:hypothetical protein